MQTFVPKTTPVKAIQWTGNNLEDVVKHLPVGTRAYLSSSGGDLSNPTLTIEDEFLLRTRGISGFFIEKDEWVVFQPQDILSLSDEGFRSTFQRIGQVSDGYHTFDELYEFRKLYHAALFNEWAKPKTMPKTIPSFIGAVVVINDNQFDIHKSWRHHDGELCFGGGWFVVVANLPTGQISNHYEAKDWDLFQVPEVDKAKYSWDGHTSHDVAKRIDDYIKKYQIPESKRLFDFVKPAQTQLL